MPYFKRAALYARFSSDLQRTESIDAQIRAMKKYCADNSFQVVKIYSDEAISGRSVTKRKGFLEMIDDSGKGIFDVVVVHKLDRFARNRYDSAIYKAKLRKNGVEVCSVLEQLNGSPESIMLEALLEGMNEYYSRNLAREVMKGMKENAYQCKHTGGPTPLGYDLDDNGKLIINEHEAEAVKLIFELYTKGYGYQYIIDTLNDTGYVTRRGCSFGKNSIYQILINEKYAGVYVYNKVASRNSRNRRNNHLYKDGEEVIRIPGGCPAIVSSEVFEKAMKRIERNRYYGAGRYNSKNCYLLTGLIRCGECHHSMVGNSHNCGRNKSKYVTYRCMTKKYNCCNKEINKEYLEDYVIELLETYIFCKRGMRKIVSDINKYITEFNASKEKRLEHLADRISEISESISNLTRLIEHGTVSSAIVDRLTELEEEKEQLSIEKEKMNAMDYVNETQYYRLIEEYEDLPFRSIEYREFVQQYISGVEVRLFDVDVTLRTGMGIADELDRTFTIRRQELYENNDSFLRKIG